MKAQGTDGMCRGQLKEGVSVGKDVLSFIPFHLSAVQRSASVETWIRSWLGPKADLLSPEGWFKRGHDLLGGRLDRKGFWRHEVKAGRFIWAPPPAAAEVTIEELRKARIKRHHSFHVFVVPRLMKPEWFRQLYKAADLVFDVPVGADCWPERMYKPLIIGLVFRFLRTPPWQLQLTPKMFSLARDLRGLWQGPQLGPGDILRKLLLEYQRLRSMPPDVVRRVLFFESKCPIPRQAKSYRRGKQQPGSSATDDRGLGQETETG
jgi:hypothetical protein